MAKYSKKLVEQICTLIRSDTYSVAEICRIVEIHKDTYYSWLKDKPDFSDAIKRAKEEFSADILVECERSLVKLIKGYTVDETKTIYVDTKTGKKDEKGNDITKPKIKEQTIIKKHVQPNLGAIIHYQTNNDPERWKNKQSMEVTGKDGKDLVPARVLTKKEAQELLNNLEKEY